jgi:hypothetical protein
MEGEGRCVRGSRGRGTGRALRGWGRGIEGVGVGGGGLCGGRERMRCTPTSLRHRRWGGLRTAASDGRGSGELSRLQQSGPGAARPHLNYIQGHHLPNGRQVRPQV